jgi:electron transport complex protein RnfD
VLPLAKTLEIRTSPHILSGYSVDTIMFNTVAALLPVVGFAVYAFGLVALITLATAIAVCVVTERLTCEATGRRSTLGDWSAVITGLLFGLTLPAGLPLWMVVVGGVTAVGMGKILFGGLGANPFNPALVGRAVLQAAFPVAMTSSLPAFGAERFSMLPVSTLTMPLSQPIYDGLSGATPLARWKFGGLSTPLDDLVFGFVGGSIGETSSLLIILGGAYLVARNMMSWRIPVVIFSVVGAMSAILHLADPVQYASPGFMLSSGGLMLGAVFMATDPVSSPVTATGRVVYGSMIGLLVMVIRVWGGMPEGVMYAILLGNAATPQIERFCQPGAYGTGPVRRAG